jgi:hypothetical protein
MTGLDYRSWFAALLRGEHHAIERLHASDTTSGVLAVAGEEGVLYLVDRALRQSGAYESSHSAVLDEVQARVRVEQTRELVRRAELSRLTEAFAREQVRMLLFKGAALAYTLYRHPHLRPRNDTDALIHPADRARAFRVLASLGYSPAVMVERDAIFTQRPFYRTGIGGTLHAVDLHWCITNRTLFRSALSFDELYDESQAVERLAASARTFSPVHSLLLASIHPVAHHRCEWPLIWLYDIDLIARQLTGADWSRFVALAQARRISIVCKRALAAAAECFNGSSWLEQGGILAIPESRASDEPSAEYLNKDLDSRAELALDLKATPGMAAKSRLLLSHVFPDITYMRDAYGATGAFTVATAYARRLGTACWHATGARLGAGR